MSQFREYNRLLYKQTMGSLSGKRIFKELTHEEVDTLISLLSHRKHRLRWSAANRLGKTKNPQAIKPLIKVMQDLHWLVRLHAVKALGCIGDSEVVKVLIKMIDDECPFVRRRVVTALGKLCEEENDRVIKVLISSLEDNDRFVRSRAVISLRKFGVPFVVDAIALAVLDQDNNVSWRAVETLEVIGNLAVPVLTDLLNCLDNEVKYRVIKTLGRIGDKRVANALKAMQDDPDERVRKRAIFAIKEINHRNRIGR